MRWTVCLVDRSNHAGIGFRVKPCSGKLHYLRTKGGAEVDFIIARAGQLTPVEVKWTEHPSLADVRHVLTFLREQPKRARQGYVICRCREALALDDQVTALPWSWF